MSTEVCINISKLIESNMSLEQFVFCMLYTKREHKMINQLAEYSFAIPTEGLKNLVESLAEDGWVKIVGDDWSRDVVPLTKFLDLFRSAAVEQAVNDIASWIDQYRAMFRVRAGHMGDSRGVLDKMTKFIRKNPQYSKDQILAATQRYIESCAGDNYRFLMHADYFIYKQDTEKTVRSRLLGFLEDTGEDARPYDKVMMI